MLKTEVDTILFPTDFSEVSSHALEFVLDFCVRAKVNLIILNIIDMPFSETAVDEKHEIDLLTHDLINLSDYKLKEIKNKIKKDIGFNIETATYLGEPTQAINRAVSDFGIKKIIMGTKPAKDYFFKSSSYDIVKSTAVPLLTISIDSHTTEFNTILFPFNEKIITLKKADEVVRIAKIYNSKIVLLGISEANNQEKISIITNQMMHIKSLFDKQNIRSEIHFSADANYAESILNYCNSNKIDLITIANNHSNTLKASLTFSSTKTIINNAHVPVLTVPVWQGI